MSFPNDYMGPPGMMGGPGPGPPPMGYIPDPMNNMMPPPGMGYGPGPCGPPGPYYPGPYGPGACPPGYGPGPYGPPGYAMPYLPPACQSLLDLDLGQGPVALRKGRRGRSSSSSPPRRHKSSRRSRSRERKRSPPRKRTPPRRGVHDARDDIERIRRERERRERKRSPAKRRSRSPSKRRSRSPARRRTPPRKRSRSPARHPRSPPRTSSRRSRSPRRLSPEGASPSSWMDEGWMRIHAEERALEAERAEVRRMNDELQREKLRVQRLQQEEAARLEDAEVVVEPIPMYPDPEELEEIQRKRMVDEAKQRIAFLEKQQQEEEAREKREAERKQRLEEKQREEEERRKMEILQKVEKQRQERERREEEERRREAERLSTLSVDAQVMLMPADSPDWAKFEKWIPVVERFAKQISRTVEIYDDWFTSTDDFGRPVNEKRTFAKFTAIPYCLIGGNNGHIIRDVAAKRAKIMIMVRLIQMGVVPHPLARLLLADDGSEKYTNLTKYIVSIIAPFMPRISNIFKTFPLKRYKTVQPREPHEIQMIERKYHEVVAPHIAPYWCRTWKLSKEEYRLLSERDCKELLSFGIRVREVSNDEFRNETYQVQHRAAKANRGKMTSPMVITLVSDDEEEVVEVEPNGASVSGQDKLTKKFGDVPDAFTESLVRPADDVDLYDYMNE